MNMPRRSFKFYLSLFLNVILIVWFLKTYKYFGERKLIINRNKLNVDERSEPNKFTIQERITKHIPYLPIEDLDGILNEARNYNMTCAWYPGIMDIHIQNEYWQILNNRNLTYYLYGAYLDDRPSVRRNRTLIRVLAIIDLISENKRDYPPTYCQLWFKDQFEPLIVPVETTQFIWRYIWGHSPKYSFPHILTCAIPDDYKYQIPKSVSLVAAPCNKASNMLRIINQKLKPNEKKREFAVCIKGLEFPYIDLSYRLVEYFETLRVMGAEKIIVYNLEVHENMTKVLDYYENTGFVEKRPFSFSLKYSNLPELRHLQLITKEGAFRLHESILYNDCIYRNMYKFKYIGVWDIDEIPLPLEKHKNWHDLVKVAENTENRCKSYAGYCFFCAYFPSYVGNFSYTKEFPEYLYMLQHVKRVRNYADYGYAMKCLHNTDYIIATHNHFPIHYASDCKDYTFSTIDAQMNHYREPPHKENLTNPVVDKSLWRFASEIVKKSMKVYEELDFFEKI